MRVLVFGSAGRTGRLIVTKALGHGHEVTAFTHKASLDMHHERLAIVRGDVRDQAAVSAAVSGQRAVAFALSAASGGATIHEDGIANVIYAMAEHGVQRLAAVSAAGAFDRSSHRMSFAQRTMIALTMGSVYDDLEAMERRIMASDLDWTIVRPSSLSDGPATGQYRFSFDGALLPKSKRISRGDVAAFLLKSLETDTYVRRAVVIAS
jgi:putative NADH-flavin reductase